MTIQICVGVFASAAAIIAPVAADLLGITSACGIRSTIGMINKM